MKTGDPNMLFKKLTLEKKYFRGNLSVKNEIHIQSMLALPEKKKNQNQYRLALL